MSKGRHIRASGYSHRLQHLPIWQCDVAILSSGFPLKWQVAQDGVFNAVGPGLLYEANVPQRTRCTKWRLHCLQLWHILTAQGCRTEPQAQQSSDFTLFVQCPHWSHYTIGKAVSKITVTSMERLCKESPVSSSQQTAMEWGRAYPVLAPYGACYSKPDLSSLYGTTKFIGLSSLNTRTSIKACQCWNEKNKGCTWGKKKTHPLLTLCANKDLFGRPKWNIDNTLYWYAGWK